MDAYGKELILDMRDCDVSMFKRKHFKRYFTELGALIDVKCADMYFWDDFRVPLEERQTDPRLKGTSAVQFILTSNITVHALDILKTMYVNIFSCDDFDVQEATAFTVSFFKAKEHTQRVLDRV